MNESPWSQNRSSVSDEVVEVSVVDPDSVGSETFIRVRIGSGKKEIKEKLI
jgi:hypothetical protein